jgi:menaquinone-specific isochorismate synthase
MMKTTYDDTTTEIKERNASGLRWVSAACAIESLDLIGFLQRCNANARMYMEHGTRSVAFAGCGTVHTVSASGQDRFVEIQRQLNSLSNTIEFDSKQTPSEAMPRWFGGFSFRSGHASEGIWSAFPAAQFVLPRRQLTQIDGQTWLTINEPLRPDETVDAAKRRLRTMLTHAVEHPLEDERHQLQPIHIKSSESLMSQDTWRKLIETTTNRIRQNELEKVVLAQACKIQAEHSVDPLDVVEALKANYDNCYRFLIEPQRGHAFFGATPELLAQVHGRTVETVAMAGSIRRGQNPDEDAMLAASLKSNPKEVHEHQVVVESIKKNLEPMTQSLAIEKNPGIEKFSNIQHLSTKIKGTFSDDVGILSVVEALHPTPAMGGTPRDIALELIETEEPFERGWYASPVGWVDIQGNGLFAVAIRSAVSVNNEVQLFAGAGIVENSEPQKEWDEIQLKFQPILNTLQ